MADERTLLEYITPNLDVFSSCIFIPRVEENNLDLKLTLINMIQNSLQFGGTPLEDPNSHIRKFLRLTETIIFNGASTNAIRLKLFPFSVTKSSNLQNYGRFASNTHQLASKDRQVVKKKETPAGMYHVDQQTMLTSQIEAINKKFEALIHDGDNCLVGAHYDQQAEEANYLGNNYNTSWRNHPNLSWGGRQNNQPPSQNPYRPPHVQNQGAFRQEKKESSFQETVMQYIPNSESRFQNIETPLGQITELLSKRAPRTIPRQQETNQRGEAKAIKVRSDKKVANSNEKEVVIGSNPKVPTVGNSEEKEESSKDDKVEMPKKEKLMEDTLGKKLLTFAENV
ncbi:hypothetical protein SESBI_07611 [Sesbania bispinosa]|nr:hypothetical protein SESBI_07611 [Sesbania bispinosa]